MPIKLSRSKCFLAAHTEYFLSQMFTLMTSINIKTTNYHCVKVLWDSKLTLPSYYVNTKYFLLIFTCMKIIATFIINILELMCKIFIWNFHRDNMKTYLSMRPKENFAFSHVTKIKVYIFHFECFYFSNFKCI